MGKFLFLSMTCPAILSLSPSCAFHRTLPPGLGLINLHVVGEWLIPSKILRLKDLDQGQGRCFPAPLQCLYGGSGDMVGSLELDWIFGPNLSTRLAKNIHQVAGEKEKAFLYIQSTLPVLISNPMKQDGHGSCKRLAYKNRLKVSAGGHWWIDI